MEPPVEDPETVVVVPDWYREMIGRGTDPRSAIRDSIGTGWAKLASQSRLGLGACSGLLMRRRRVALIKGHRGSMLALLIAALPPARRNGIVFEFIRRPEPPPGWRRALYRVYWRFVERPVIRRAMAHGQVLTPAELERYSREYGLGQDRLSLVLWPLMRGEALRPHGQAVPRSVLSSGRTSCDWATLFAAADGSDWQLTVVCARPDRALVERLAQDTEVRAEILCEIARERHDELLRRASVYVLPLIETGSSSGHVRLMSAVEAGTPVVASDVTSIAGYVVPGETALLVPPSDPTALRSSVDQLLEDPRGAASLATNARERAAGWAWPDYFQALGRLIEDSWSSRV